MNGPASIIHKTCHRTNQRPTYNYMLAFSVPIIRTRRAIIEAGKIEISRPIVVSAEHALEAFYSLPNNFYFLVAPAELFLYVSLLPSHTYENANGNRGCSMGIKCHLCEMSPGTFACEASTGETREYEGKSEGTFYSHVETTRVAPVSGQHCVKSNIYTRSTGLWINQHCLFRSDILDNSQEVNLRAFV